MLLEPFFYASYKYIPNNVSQLESFIFVGGLWGYLYYQYKLEKICFSKLCSYALLVVLGDLFIVDLYRHTFNKAIWHFSGGVALTISLYFWLKIEEYTLEDRVRLNSLFIMALGFWLKFYYVLITPINRRQHDMYSFDRHGLLKGHAGYIDYFLRHWHLPDTDITKNWGFCHPPLHHIISAVWIWIHENILYVGHAQSRESLQTLSLFYTLVIIITAYKIFKYCKLQEKALYIPLLLVSFHPAFILFSGSVNNDVLSVALMMLAVLFTLEWCESKSWQVTLKIALCIGLGMMAKLSAALIFPLVFLFMLTFVNRENYRELVKQLGLLSIVTIPLGLWYQIRSYIKWGVPLNYVQEIKITNK
ncbi:glycosyltransferase family 39 protein, partial [bacterium]|nr:glycosyltransferase family 39 protein [bacterium]